MADFQKNSINLDEILSKYDLYQPYQLRMLLMLGVVFLFNGMHCVNYIFVAEESPYRCKMEECEKEDHSFNPSWYNFTAPTEYRNCHKYGIINHTNESYNSVCLPEHYNTSVTISCEEWMYESGDSFTSEFQLACDDWKRSLVGTVHSLGLMIGLLLQGQLSDKVGRKAAIILAAVAAALFGVGKSFASSYMAFIVLELFEAMLGDNCSPAYIMSVELVANDHRLQQQIILSVLYAIGGILISVFAWYIHYWRHFVQAIYLPSLLLLLYYFYMDESVRWLLSKGRKKEAVEILMKMAKRNGTKLDEKLISNLKYEEGKLTKSPILKTLRSRIVLGRLFVCLVWWISCNFICFGLLINSVSLAGNKYINFAVMSISDVPVTFLMLFILKRYNRKKPLIVSFILAGLMCISQTFVPKDQMFLSVGLYMMGKILSTFTFSTVYLYTSELFPTYSRNSMHALCSSIGRIGSILAPMTPLLMQYNESLPTTLIGGISLMAGLVTLAVPDLADQALPDTVHQAETLGCPGNELRTTS